MTEIDVLDDKDLPNGQMKAVKAGAKQVVLCRSNSGEVHALEDRCSHAEVKLSRGLFDGKEVTCVAHGARFDAQTGKALCMPAVTGVKSFPVRVVEGRILVTVS